MITEAAKLLIDFDLTIKTTNRHLNYDAIASIKAHLKKAPATRLIKIDLSEVEVADTAAFAELVVIRRWLLGSGRDMRISGLQDRALALYHLIHLNHILPTE